MSLTRRATSGAAGARWLRPAVAKFVVVIAAGVVAAGGMGLFWFQNQQNKNKMKADQEAARLTSIRDQSSTEVRQLLDDGKFLDAQKAVDEWRMRGISDEQAKNLGAQVSASVRETRSKLLDRANSLVNKKDIAGAKKIEEEVRLLDRSMNAGDERTERLTKQIRDLEKNLKAEATSSVLAEIRKAIKAKDWEQAQNSLERARATSIDRSLLRSAEDDLRCGMGGRLKVTGTPRSAEVRVAGRPPAKMGEVVSGLSDGDAEIKVTAPGFIAVTRSVAVRYPEIKEEAVELLRQPPPSLWAIKSLAGLCGQTIAVEYYREKVTDRAVLDAISELTQPCPAPPQVDQVPSRRGKDVQILVENIFKNKDRLTEVAVLNELGVLVAERPEAISIMKNKSRKVKKCLDVIEKGCLGCQGSGIMVCHDCNGAKKRIESRKCNECKGQGRIKCPNCHGQRRVKCPKCHGQGSSEDETVDPGPHGIGQSRSIWRKCGKCGGQKWVPCKNPKCDIHGMASCPKCNGNGKTETMGECSTCHGQGGTPCSLCGGKKKKADMPVDKRQEAEQELAELLTSMSATRGG